MARVCIRRYKKSVPAWILVVGALAGAGCPSAEKHTQVSFAREGWNYRGAKGTQCASAHYILRTTCTSKPFVDALPGFLESCYVAYSELLPPQGAADKPLDTYLFQTRWQWERFTEQFAGPRAATYKQIRSGGYSERGVTV